MKKMTKRMVTLALVATGLGLAAQSVLTLPKFSKPSNETAITQPQQETGKSTQVAGGAQGLVSAADQAIYEEFMSMGQQPASRFAPQRDPNAPEDSTIYVYTGFNAKAGVDADGNAIGGWVNFNLQPFKCDTVSSHSGASPYSYVRDGKLYSFGLIYDYTVKGYKSMTRTTYDANTLEVLEQRTFTDCNPTGDQSRVPYMMTYDDQRDVVWVISMSATTPQGTSGNTYYLNILDTATCKLQRVGMLGYYGSDRAAGNYVPKAFTAGYYGSLYVLLKDDKNYVATLDPTTLETKKIGSANMPNQYIYGLQPMIYNSITGNLLVNHYDLNNGTQYYNVGTFVPYGSQEDTVKTEFIENAPTGFTYFSSVRVSCPPNWASSAIWSSPSTRTTRPTFRSPFPLWT